jgi:NADP-dependent 3-hydroxy acid dehydrogenase YdfG
MDAVLYYCEQNFLDPKDIASMINKSLKEKIHMNATELNFFPKQGSLDV